MKRFFLFYIVFTSFLYAQNEYQLDEILVQAQLERDAIETRKNSPYSKVIFTQRDIMGFGHQTAGDVIKRLPGLYMQGPLNIQRNVKMAGLDKEFQCILINGNRPFGGGDRRDIKLDRIPVNLIEKIEVIKNPPSSLAADAVSGVVNIILKKTPSSHLVNVDLNGGKNTNSDRYNGRIITNLSKQIGDLSILAGISYHDYERLSKTDFTKFSASGFDNEWLDVKMSSLNMNLDYKLSNTANLVFTPFITYYDEFTTIEDENSLNEMIYEEDDATEDKMRVLQNYGLTYTNRFDNDVYLKVHGNFTANREDKYKDRATKTLNETKLKFEDEEQRAQDYFVSGDLSFVTELLGLTGKINTGLKYSYNDRSVYRLVTQQIEGSSLITYSDESYTIDENLFSSYIESDFVVSPEINFIAGIRFETTSDIVKAAETEKTKDYNSLNPFFSISYKPFASDLYLKGIFSKQISRPPFQYIAPVVKRKNRKTEEGNFDLLPAKSYNFNLSLENYFDDRSYVSVSGYYKDITDVIEQSYVGDDPLNNDNPIFKAVNISEASVYGIELELEMSLHKYINNLAFSINGSLLDSDLLDPVTGKKRRLKDQPEYIVNFELVYANPDNGLDVTLGLNHIGKRIDPESGTLELVQKNFTQVDVQVRYYISESINLYANGINLFNEKAHFTQGSETRIENLGTTFKIGAALNL